MTAPIDSYSVASGQPIYGGRSAPNGFISVTTIGTLADTAVNANEWGTKPFVIDLHGSGGQNFTTGQKFRATVAGPMALPGASSKLVNNEYDAHNTFGFSLAIEFSRRWIALRPIDFWYNDAGVRREALHMGLVLSDGRLHLIEERRNDGMVTYAETSEFGLKTDRTRWALTGGSMGGWGSGSYGIRRYYKFAALYPDRPRWYGAKDTMALGVLDGGADTVTYTKATMPLLANEDGGGSAWDYLDEVSYVRNKANKVRPILWCVGRQDGFSPFADHLVMLQALLDGGRMCAWYWNNGGHGAGSRVDMLTRGYPMNLYKIGEGWPCYTNFSRNQDPQVHIAGGINLDLQHRKVVETPTGWSCEIACVTPLTSTGKVWTYDNYTPFATTASSIQVYIDSTLTTESEIPDYYVGGTITIGGETRTITAYTPVGIDPNDGGHNRLTPGVVTVSSPFTNAPVSGTAYTLTRLDPPSTVDVLPVSEIFTKVVAKITVNLPASGVWVPVSFS